MCRAALLVSGKGVEANRVDAPENAESFAKMLEENANLGWNICMVANTIITETDGEYVLFMMCQEDTWSYQAVHPF